MVRSREEAIKAALKQTRNVPGTCQKTTRLWYDAPSAGDRDGDGDADAVDGWNSEPASARHPGDRNPPVGVPLAWKGGSKGYGHRAMTVPGGIRSTDMSGNRYKSGITSTVTAKTMSEAISIIERSMGVQYLGWSETISGNRVYTKPTPPPAPKPPKGLLFESVIFTCNLRSLPKNPNLSATLKSVAGCDIGGFQEADLPEFKRALVRKYPRLVGLGPIDDNRFASPLRVNANLFRHLSEGTTKLYNGAAGISYTRHLSWVVAEHKKTGAKFGVVNLHSVVLKRDKSYDKRRTMQLAAKDALVKQVEKFQRDGLPVIVTGDFNATTNWLGSSFGGQRVQRVRSGVDQILLVNGEDATWSIVRSGTTDTPSDHDTLRVRARLIKR